MEPIITFAAEERAGIAEAVRSLASFAYESPLVPGPGLVVAAEGTDEVLFAMRDVLGTVGWNLNDDVLTAAEAYAARHTADNKPLNFLHDRTRVIGHIISSHLATLEDHAPIADDTPLDALPGRFHVVNDTVIYRLPLPKTPAEADQAALIERTIAEIRAGEWFVSLEALFGGFDYAVIGPDGTHFAVARDEQTAWLSAYLKAYQPDRLAAARDPLLGTGTFRDRATGAEYRIGRLLRGVRFSGKGLVRRPANPDSIIFQSVDHFQPQSVYLPGSAGDPPTENVPMPEINEAEALRSQLAEAVAKVATLTAEADALKNQKHEERIADLAAEVEAKAAEAASLSAQLEATREAVAGLTRRAEAAETALATAQAEAAEARKAEVARARKATLVERGAADAADVLVARLAPLSDAEFAETVEVLSASWKKPAGDIAAIDNARPEPEPALATAGEARTGIGEATASYLKSFLNA